MKDVDDVSIVGDVAPRKEFEWVLIALSLIFLYG